MIRATGPTTETKSMPNPTRILLAAAAATLVLASNAGAKDKIEIKIGSVTIKDTVHQWMINFEKNVERRIGNRVDVRVFPAGQLGGIPRQIEGVQLGTQEMTLLPPDFFVGIDKRFMVTSSPGIFRDLRHAQNSLHDPDFKKMFFSMGDKKNITGVGIYCGDLAHYVSRGRSTGSTISRARRSASSRARSSARRCAAWARRRAHSPSRSVASSSARHRRRHEERPSRSS